MNYLAIIKSFAHTRFSERNVERIQTVLYCICDATIRTERRNKILTTAMYAVLWQEIDKIIYS